MYNFDNFIKKTSMKLKGVFKSDKIPESWIRIYFKSYPRFPKIILPEAEDSASMQIYDVLKKRRSIRKFNKEKITLQELSNILYYSAGIKDRNITNINETRRFYPSAGARYPIELYLSITSCEDIDPGLYHYNVKEHSLELLYPGKHNKEIFGFVYQDMLLDAPIIFFMTGVFNRCFVKYGNRSLRYVLFDIGHMVQNIYLTSTANKIGFCSVGGFSDKEARKFLDVVEDEYVLYMGVLGKYDD